MRVPIEIVLRHDPTVFTDVVVHPGEPAQWSVEDVRAILEGALLAVDRVQHPGAHPAPPVSLRGLSWIVSPYKDGVVIAFEIHSASAVAGPFQADQQLLTHLVAGAVAAEPPPTTH
jgi:hypothetical protein